MLSMYLCMYLSIYPLGDLSRWTYLAFCPMSYCRPSTGKSCVRNNRIDDIGPHWIVRNFWDTNPISSCWGSQHHLTINHHYLWKRWEDLCLWDLRAKVEGEWLITGCPIYRQGSFRFQQDGEGVRILDIRFLGSKLSSLLGRHFLDSLTLLTLLYHGFRGFLVSL